MKCPDCGCDPWALQENDATVHEDFYVSHELWEQVCPDDHCVQVGDGFWEGTFAICISCFERRLGRRLVRADFTSTGPNPFYWEQMIGCSRSARFEDRLRDDAIPERSIT